MRNNETDLPRHEVALRLPVLIALALAAVALFHGSRGLYESTEGRYAECAREMAQTGTWLEPVLDGQPHWTKPPLTYLAIRLPYMALGPTTWAARLYLIPCFLVSISAVWWLAFRLWGDRPTARMSAMVYASSVMPMLASQAVSTDYLLTAALAVAQAAFWEGVRKRSSLGVHLFWLSMGVAFLIKGPPALLVLPAALVVWLGLPRQDRLRVPLFAPTALALFLIVGLGWYAWESWRHPGLLGYWLKDEVVERSLSEKFRRNPHFYSNFTIYLPVLLLGSLPWGGWLAFRWRALWERVRVSGGGRKLWTGRSAEARWLALTVGVPLAVFCLSRSKLPLYVLPLFVPGAVAMGRLLLTAYGQEVWFRKSARATLYAAFFVFVAGKAAMSLLPQEKDMSQLRHSLTAQYGVRDPARLAVVGDKALNGLSYYYDSILKNVSLDEVAGWADAGGERFLLCDNRKAVEAKKILNGWAIEEQVLSPHRRLLRIVVPSPGTLSKR